MEIEAERAQERVEAALGAVETKTEALDEIQHAAGEAAALHDRLHDRLIDLKRAAAESIHREAMKSSRRRRLVSRAPRPNGGSRKPKATLPENPNVSKKPEKCSMLVKTKGSKTGTSELLEKCEPRKALAAAQTELEAARSKREDEQRQIKRLNESILPLTEEIARLRVEAEQKAGLLGQFSGRMQELGAD